MFCGEKYYLAPEIASEGKPYTTAADKWALGMLLLEMTTMNSAKSQLVFTHHKFGEPINAQDIKQGLHHKTHGEFS